MHFVVVTLCIADVFRLWVTWVGGGGEVYVRGLVVGCSKDDISHYHSVYSTYKVHRISLHNVNMC